MSQHSSIDAFLISLAEHPGGKTPDARLWGAGTDGTPGLKAIKEAGKPTLAQSLRSATYDGILLSANQIDLVDFEVDMVKTQKLLAELLIRILPATRGAQMHDRHRQIKRFSDLGGGDEGTTQFQ